MLLFWPSNLARILYKKEIIYFFHEWKKLSAHCEVGINRFLVLGLGNVFPVEQLIDAELGEAHKGKLTVVL